MWCGLTRYRVGLHTHCSRWMVSQWESKRRWECRESKRMLSHLKAGNNNRSHSPPSPKRCGTSVVPQAQSVGPRRTHGKTIDRAVREATLERCAYARRIEKPNCFARTAEAAVPTRALVVLT